MNKKVESFCKFIFFLAVCRAGIVFLAIIPFFVLKELGWIGSVIEIIIFIAAILDFRKNKKKKSEDKKCEKKLL